MRTPKSTMFAVETKEAAIGGLAVLGFLLLAVLLVLWGGFVLSVLWGWFVVPLGLPAINYIHAVGLTLTVGVLFGPGTRKVKSGEWLGSFIGWGILPLLFGYLVHLAM